ncbi:WbqC family protein, partial [Patescibacteria group bacterium]|nr:WbqC family protein [Patescibacteria group bacterium]
HVRKHKYPDGRVDKSYQIHTPIKQSFGQDLLSVPVKNKFALITSTLITYNQDWVADHLKTLQVVYGRAPNFQKLFREISLLLSSRYKSIAELNIATTLWAILRILGEENIQLDNLSIDYVNKKLKDQSLFRLKKIVRASETKTFKNKKGLGPNEKIISLCKEVGATEDYCGGTGAATYMDQELYKKNGIKITVQDWKCAQYPQLFTKQQGFIPNLSIIDLLMNVSTKKAVEVIKG